MSAPLRAYVSPAVGHVSARYLAHVAATLWGMFQFAPDHRTCLSPLGGRCFPPIVGHVSARFLWMFQPHRGACLSPHVCIPVGGSHPKCAHVSARTGGWGAIVGISHTECVHVSCLFQFLFSYPMCDCGTQHIGPCHVP